MSTSSQHTHAPRRGCPLILAAWLLLAGAARTGHASDHADPIFVRGLEAGLTGLFAFPDPAGEHLVLVLGVHRAYTEAVPRDLDLESHVYRIHLDTTSGIVHGDADAELRYGGRVEAPEKIEADIVLEYRLDDDTDVVSWSARGLADPESLRPPWTGIRDDPFILHRFSDTNIVAIVQEIPLDRLGPDRRQLLVWATSSRGGRQIDHVGRALRTMQPRFEMLNTLHPSEHVAAIRAAAHDPGVVQDLLATYVSILFEIRHYDEAPDVMLLDLDRPIGFPNGRRLTDDVATMCCSFGECLLYEDSVASAAAAHTEHPTTNNVSFLAEYPYLAPPNPARAPVPARRPRLRTVIIVSIVVLAGVTAFLVLPWLLYVRAKRETARLRRRLAA